MTVRPDLGEEERCQILVGLGMNAPAPGVAAAPHRHARPSTPLPSVSPPMAVTPPTDPPLAVPLSAALPQAAPFSAAMPSAAPNLCRRCLRRRSASYIFTQNCTVHRNK